MLNAALRASTSPSWSDRANAGRQLAAHADVPAVTEVLRRLLQDGRDTAVTQQTAEALLERRDVLGLRLVLGAFAGADFDTADHLSDAILNVCLQSDEDQEYFEGLTSELASDAEADEAARTEAVHLLQRWNPRP
ncbi:HEAT repeat domain-containing protein [Kitasatospora sp. NPDC001660]